MFTKTLHSGANTFCEVTVGAFIRIEVMILRYYVKRRSVRSRITMRSGRELNIGKYYRCKELSEPE